MCYGGAPVVEQLEATTLSYLADNIGGTGANYGPVCVQARRDAYAEEQVPDRGRMTLSNTVEMEITYTVKNTRKLLIKAIRLESHQSGMFLIDERLSY